MSKRLVVATQAAAVYGISDYAPGQPYHVSRGDVYLADSEVALKGGDLFVDLKADQHGRIGTYGDPIETASVDASNRRR